MRTLSLSSSKNLGLLTIALLALLVANSNIHVPCLPSIRDEFKTNDFWAQFAIIINPFVAIVVNLLSGFWADTHGRKPLLKWGVFLMMMGSIACFLSNSILGFLMGRLLQAVGDGILAVITLVILSDFFKGEEFGKYLGLSAIFSATTWGLAPFLGAKTLELWGWRWNFLVILASVGVCGLILIIYLPETLKEEKKDKTNLFSYIKNLLTLVQIPKFALAILAHSIPVGLFGAFESSCPFLYIDTYNFSSTGFAFVKGALVASNTAAALLYTHTLSFFKLKGELLFGTIMHGLFILGLCSLLFQFIPDGPYIILSVFCLHTFCGPFVTSACSVIGLEAANNNKGLAVSLFFLVRNIFSTVLSLIAAAYFNDSVYPFLVMALPVSITVFGLLFKLMNSN